MFFIHHYNDSVLSMQKCNVKRRRKYKMCPGKKHSEDKHNIQPLLISANEASRLLGISRASLYACLSSGRIGPTGVRIGGRRLFILEELHHWVALGCPIRRQYLEILKNETRK